MNSSTKRKLLVPVNAVNIAINLLLIALIIYTASTPVDDSGYFLLGIMAVGFPLLVAAGIASVVLNLPYLPPRRSQGTGRMVLISVSTLFSLIWMGLFIFASI